MRVAGQWTWVQGCGQGTREVDKNLNIYLYFSWVEMRGAGQGSRGVGRGPGELTRTYISIL